MRRFAVSAMVAGGLFAAALGAAGAASATDIYFGNDGAGVMADDGSGIAVGQNGFTVSLPGTDHSAYRHYDADRRYDSWNGRGYDQHYGWYGPCAPGYCR